MKGKGAGEEAGKEAGRAGDWWFCLRHMRVEHGPGCPDKDRMGPYDSEPAAAGALELARALVSAGSKLAAT